MAGEKAPPRWRACAETTNGDWTSRWRSYEQAVTQARRWFEREDIDLCALWLECQDGREAQIEVGG